MIPPPTTCESATAGERESGRRQGRVLSLAPRVLIGCECSGRVRSEFRALGCDAWSCDLKPAEDGDRHHIQADVLTVIDGYFPGHGQSAFEWDAAVFHPECTYLCNSGVRWLFDDNFEARKARWVEMRKACRFFLKLWNCSIPRIAIENPVMHGHAKNLIGIHQTQTVQPWHFGDPERKATCLWLKNLPPLVATDRVLPLGNSVHHEPPGPNRKANRSRTFPGFARAMAQQWSSLLSPSAKELQEQA